MSYHPKFCCECREKIDRTVWRPWTSPRFCELCATDFGVYDKIRFGALISLALISIVGVGNMLRKPERELAISSNQLYSTSVNSNRQTSFSNNAADASNKSGVQNSALIKSANVSEQSKQASPAESNSQASAKQNVAAPTPVEEKVYFCGAQTKKGAPCTRRVKKPERCWQHAGQPPMLPPQKLIAGR